MNFQPEKSASCLSIVAALSLGRFRAADERADLVVLTFILSRYGGFDPSNISLLPQR